MTKALFQLAGSILDLALVLWFGFMCFHSSNQGKEELSLLYLIAAAVIARSKW